MRATARLAGLLLAVHLAAPARADARSDCDGPAFARVLQPSTQPAIDKTASAYWLDAAHLRWPGHPQEARYALFVADAPTLKLEGDRLLGADRRIALQRFDAPLTDDLTQRFGFIGAGATLALPPAIQVELDTLLQGQVVLAQLDANGRVIDHTALQLPGALDDRYAAAAQVPLGATLTANATQFALWAPTARAVQLCLYHDDASDAFEMQPMTRDAATGVWQRHFAGRRGGTFYRFLVDVFVPGTGLVRNRVSDPYAVSLGVNGERSVVLDLDDPALASPGWRQQSRPPAADDNSQLSIYELHVRDFSRDDASVPAAHRGKYLAFTDTSSDGMHHLAALAQAGLTDVHLLPAFDFASVPEAGCVTPQIPQTPTDSQLQQAAVMASAARDCFNWGYDPLHFGAPEGSYASDAADGTRRVIEFRQMVMALHALGLRVGMDVVYNHTSASGQQASSVLDRIVPGYYQRLDAQGRVATSTCCANTATEHRMMARLMIDTAVRWARDYRVDGFRFDLMGHQPRAAMEALQRAVDAAAGRHIPLLGEGWNFGEIVDGARFVQAAQGRLGGTGIGTFSDRARDAIRGGTPGDRGDALRDNVGWLNADWRRDADSPALAHAADLLRLGLAGTLVDFPVPTHDARTVRGDALDYRGQPAGYATAPGEVVNYVENHDNHTLFDIDALRAPDGTTAMDLARMQALGLATVAFSQGAAYFHAGGERLRSKSLDRNSFDSGDAFNRLTWTGADNGFVHGLPPAPDNQADWPLLAPKLADPNLKPGAAEIAFASARFEDWLRIRASSSLFRLRTADEVRARLRFPALSGDTAACVVVGHLHGGELDGQRIGNDGFAEVLYLFNACPDARAPVVADARGKPYVLHPVQRETRPRADPQLAQARFDRTTGRFTLPGRSAVVYVIERARQ
ncbi:alpha-1,6-glucosidase domain-containing protein [Pseudoxanthomonas sp. GM95]|uniref:alpha-1,6-glucosidase domain-containing protein n=1 Tax=Pseudoxanthomonas sp. GM95 TaxID=1881043 RepID=UPI0020C8A9F0|nr:alpha-1,6-glucosidase domain-containing protein [Pseudoxanthomonas sp. GM95]